MAAAARAKGMGGLQAALELHYASLWVSICTAGVRRPLIVVLDMYIIAMTIVGSIIIYPAKNMAYIDALFFASGGATQSGLNT